MDHLDGIKNLFDEFKISNFWDTNNNKRMNESGFGGYKKEDWDFYQKIRRSKDDITVLNLYDGSKGKYYNCDDDGGKGDYLQVLCPTKELIRDINTAHSGYNNCSYVILYNECDKKILFCGDGEAKEWDALLEKHEDILTDIDVLIAPHHGRKSGGNDAV